MVSKKHLLTGLLLWGLIGFVQAQQLNLGFKLGHASMRLRTLSEMNYYYSDDANTHYQLRAEDQLVNASPMSPYAYAQAYFNDNIFLNLEVGHYAFYKDYLVTVNEENQGSATTTYRFNCQFLTNKLSLGYRFLRTKTLRPKLYAGVGYLHLLQFTELEQRSEENLLRNIEPYGKVIHSQLNSIANGASTWHVGFGLEFYQLSLDLYYERNLTSNDQQASNSYYGSSDLIVLTAGLRLANIMVKGKKVKYEEL